MKNVKIVIGASFGDEGKGLMTDYFASEAAKRRENCLVICSNGGAQRGHTVTTPDGRRHVFHHFGSGVYAGADTYLPYYYILNPMFFGMEYDELPVTRVYAHPDCPVTTPFDMMINQIIEEHRGSGRHGSCGVGIWETLIRDGFRYGEMCMMNDTELRAYLMNDCKLQLWKRLERLGVERIRDEWNDIIESPGIIENYIEDFRFMQRTIEMREVDLIRDYDNVIFENGQGLLLDRNRHEYGCNTTPSNTGLRNPAELMREYFHHFNPEMEEAEVEVCYVSRTYLTRHGAGRFDEECDKADINEAMVDMTNVPNPYQGTIRYGKLNTAKLIKRIRNDYDSEGFPRGCRVKRTLALTHLNEYMDEEAEKLRKEAAYISDGMTREDMVTNQIDFEMIKSYNHFDNKKCV